MLPLALEGEAVLAVWATIQTEPFQDGLQILLKVPWQCGTDGLDWKGVTQLYR